jgi:putative transposase
MSPAQVRAALAVWRNDYNAVRPNSKRGGRTSAEPAEQAVSGPVPIELAIHSILKHLTRRQYF